MTPESVRTRELRVDGVRTMLREAGPAGGREAAVFVHGNPGSSADWAGLLERAGGVCRAVAWDAPGFGNAGKPPDFPHTVDGHAAFIGKTLDTSASTEPTSSSTTSAAPGACGGPPPTPASSPARSSSTPACCSATAGMR